MRSIPLGIGALVWARSRKVSIMLMATLGLLLLSLPLLSQGNFGRILGTVTDQSGGVVAGATVTVIDAERGRHANPDHG